MVIDNAGRTQGMPQQIFVSSEKVSVSPHFPGNCVSKLDADSLLMTHIHKTNRDMYQFHPVPTPCNLHECLK